MLTRIGQLHNQQLQLHSIISFSSSRSLAYSLIHSFINSSLIACRNITYTHMEKCVCVDGMPFMNERVEIYLNIRKVRRKRMPNDIIFCVEKK
jgi:hypothetical protein